MRQGREEGPDESPSRLLRLGKAIGVVGVVALVGSMVAGSLGFEAAGSVVEASAVPLAIGGLAVIASGMEHAR